MPGEDRLVRFAGQAFFTYIKRMNAQSPIVSEFDTPEEQAAYEAWLKAKVAASLADERPNVAHDEAIGRATAAIAAARRRDQAC